MKKLGRPNIPDDQKRVHLSTTISKESIEYLVQNKSDNLSIGQFLDYIISKHRNIHF